MSLQGIHVTVFQSLGLRMNFIIKGRADTQDNDLVDWAFGNTVPLAAIASCYMEN